MSVRGRRLYDIVEGGFKGLKRFSPKSMTERGFNHQKCLASVAARVGLKTASPGRGARVEPLGRKKFRESYLDSIWGIGESGDFPLNRCRDGGDKRIR